MPQYLSPGVYVEEVDRGSKPIEGVGTSIAAFVGFAEKGPRAATLVTSWEQYQLTFGGFISGAFMPASVYGFFLNGGTRAYIVRVSPAVTIPQKGSAGTALEVTPLLSAGDEAVSVTVSDGAAGRYKLTVHRGNTTETFDDLSSDKKDKAGRYVEDVINDAAKGSKFVRVHDASGNRAEADVRAPKSGSYSSPSSGGDSKPVAELPPASVRLNARTGEDAPAVELRPAPGVSGSLNVAIEEIAGQDELFKLIVKSSSGESESFDVSFKKGPQYLENVINGGRTGSKWVRVRDLTGESPTSPADKRPNPGQSTLVGATETKTLSSKITLTSADFTGDVMSRTGLGGLEALDDVTIVMCPDLMSLYQRGVVDMKGVQVVQTAMMNHCEAMKNRVAILDAPPGMNAQQIRNWRMREANYDSKYAALYFPWIEVDDPVNKGKTTLIPPSGHMAGIWARSDSERGVHKAPANEIVRGAIGLEMQITMGEQDGLNPEGINCIRAFPGRGIRVWGARTLSSDPSWRYLNVRRLFNYVEASIERGTQWVVFEPNDFDLWQRIKQDINSFLTTVWLNGALFGQTTDQAYFVRCDDSTNLPATIDLGMVITEIGIAPVKPAEFVIFRIGQMTQGGA
ncbi:phage tail sheath subtilisin-like domain-containing protein [Candidatus Chlorohelix sp.]|uniref:phage tail sheath subtilisin-like domain-containing protein n=1 Tax=Candidatus Chlorohelix sp. TaxID=3139201 RepID=UPI003046DB5C